MADYFTNFSLIMKLPSEAAQKHALDLAVQARDMMYEGAKPPIDFPASLAEVIDDWQFETEAENLPDGCSLWLHSDCSGIDSVCAFIHHLLQTFDPSGRVTFEWSHDCSKPLVDAYGGGAAIITAYEIKTMNTCQWLHENAA